MYLFCGIQVRIQSTEKHKKCNFEFDNDKNVSSILVELVYNIFAACSIYVNVFQYSKNTDKNDRNVNEKHLHKLNMLKIYCTLIPQELMTHFYHYQIQN